MGKRTAAAAEVTIQRSGDAQKKILSTLIASQRYGSFKQVVYAYLERRHKVTK